eukprot:jgi/Mesvir1/19603/Mv09900-RA.1
MAQVTSAGSISIPSARLTYIPTTIKPRAANTVKVFSKAAGRASLVNSRKAFGHNVLLLTAHSRTDNHKACRPGSVRAQAAPAGEAAADGKFAALKSLLDDVKGLGRIRIIVNTGMGVLESVTTLDKLFYSDAPGGGQWGNVMANEQNVDFHLRLDRIASVKIVKGTSPRGGYPTYMLRFQDSSNSVGVSFFMMWPEGGEPGSYEKSQVDAFEALLAKHGEDVAFPAA